MLITSTQDKKKEIRLWRVSADNDGTFSADLVHSLQPEDHFPSADRKEIKDCSFVSKSTCDGGRLVVYGQFELRRGKTWTSAALIDLSSNTSIEFASVLENGAPGKLDAFGVCVSAVDGKVLLYGGSGKSLWDVHLSPPVQLWTAANDINVGDAACLCHNGTLIRCTGDNLVHTHLDDNSEICRIYVAAQLGKKLKHIWSVCISPSQELVAVATSSGIVIYQPRSWIIITTLDAVGNHYVQFTQDGTKLVSSQSGVCNVSIWDVSTGALLSTIPGWHVACLPNLTEYIACTSNIGAVKVCNVETGIEVFSWKAHNSSHVSICGVCPADNVFT
jgi:hypothetical protein